MPSPWHDAVTQLVDLSPDLPAEIVRDLMGEPLPGELTVHVAPPNFNDRPSTDFDCDAVVIAGPHRDPVRGIIVEAQHGQVAEKRQKFAKYAAELWILLGCPVDVLVICPDAVTCDYYSAPVMTTLPGYVHTPRPLHPGLVPVVTEPRQMAASPGLAVLVVAFHGEVPGVPEAFVEGMGMLGESGSAYYELGCSLAAVQTKRYMEELVATSTLPAYSDWAKKQRAEGKAEGEARGEREALLLILRTRGLAISDEHRNRIQSCTDTSLLQKWIASAVTVKAVEELFG